MTDSYKFYARLGEIEVYYRPSKDIDKGIEVTFLRDEVDIYPSFALGWVPSCKIEAAARFDDDEVRALELFLKNNATLIIEHVVEDVADAALCEIFGTTLEEVKARPERYEDGEIYERFPRSS